MNLFFHAVGGIVQLRGRMEGEDGLVGDFYHELKPGEDIFGISYDELEQYKNGTIIMDEDKDPVVKPYAESE